MWIICVAVECAETFARRLLRDCLSLASLIYSKISAHMRLPAITLPSPITSMRDGARARVLFREGLHSVSSFFFFVCLPLLLAFFSFFILIIDICCARERKKRKKEKFARCVLIRGKCVHV